MNLRWPTLAIVFVYLLCVIVVIYKHNKLKQKQCQDDVKLFIEILMFLKHNSKGGNLRYFGLYIGSR